MTDKFIVEECNFQGEDGYYLKQIHNGKSVCGQFVPADIFDEFCKKAGIEPEIRDNGKAAPKMPKKQARRSSAVVLPEM